MFWIALFFYNVLYPVGVVLMAPAWMIKMYRRGGYGTGLWQRVGCYDTALLREVRGQDYYHAVSVGEVILAIKIIREQRARNPQYRCLLAVSTATGYQVAQARSSSGVTVLYSPLDCLPVLHRLFRNCAPRKVILIDSELWPNLLLYLSQKAIPICVVNGRISSRSLARYQKFEVLVQPLVARFSLVCVDHEVQAQRWESLGVLPEKIKVVGSLKFDFSPPPESEKGQSSRRPSALLTEQAKQSPLVLLASTHPGEERAILSQIASLPACSFVVIPRHAERHREIEKELKALQLEVYSPEEGDRFLAQPGAVLLVATTGELMHWMEAATLVLIGKSWLYEGGQNPFESLSLAVPTLCGPAMQNFEPLVSQLVEQGVLRQCGSLETVRQSTEKILQEVKVEQQYAKEGQAALRALSGATQRSVDELQAVRTG